MSANTSTVTSVTSSATVVTLVAANSGRRALSVFNESTAILRLKLGAGASATSYTVQIPPSGYWELSTIPATDNEVLGSYPGLVTGIWASVDGSARITEVA